jgi:hypothetical protein
MDAFRSLLGGLVQAIPGIAEAGAAAGIDFGGEREGPQAGDDDDEAPTTYTRYLVGGPRELGINDT